jgi:hypothetical protein
MMLRDFHLSIFSKNNLAICYSVKNEHRNKVHIQILNNKQLIQNKEIITWFFLQGFKIEKMQERSNNE